VIPFALAFYLAGNTPKLRKLGGAVLLMTVTATVLTMSRGAWLAMFAGASFMLVIHSIQYIKLMLAGVVVFPLFMIVVPNNPLLDRVASIWNPVDTSMIYRRSIWVASVRMIRDFWFSGIGTGAETFTAIYPNYALSGAAFALHSHSLYLHMIIELGIVGMILFVCVLYKFFQMSLTGYKRLEDKQSRYIMLAAASAAVAILIFGIADNTWYNYRIFLQFWLVIGLGALTARSCGHEWKAIGGETS
jgi:O-antigen ligase